MIRPSSAPVQATRRGVGIRFVEAVVASNEPGRWFEWADPVGRGVLTRRVREVAAAAGVELHLERVPSAPGSATTEFRLKGRLRGDRG